MKQKIIITSIIFMVITAIVITILLCLKSQDINSNPQAISTNEDLEGPELEGTPNLNLLTKTELNLSKSGADYILTSNDNITYSYLYNKSNFLISDNKLSPKEKGKHTLLISYDINNQNFSHIVTINIFDITTPSFEVLQNSDNTFNLSICNCPALSFSTVTASPKLNYTNEVLIEEAKLTRTFSTDSLNFSFTAVYEVELDNYTNTFTSTSLSATQTLEAQVSSNSLTLINYGHEESASEDNVFFEGELNITKSLNIDNANLTINASDESIIEVSGNKYKARATGECYLYIYYGLNKLYEQLITVTPCEATTLSLDEDIELNKQYTLTYEPSYALVSIKNYNEEYLTLNNLTFTALRVGQTQVQIENGAKTITRNINLTAPEIAHANNIVVFKDDERLTDFSILVGQNLELDIYIMTGENFAESQVISISNPNSNLLVRTLLAPRYIFSSTVAGSYAVTLTATDSKSVTINIIVS